MASQQHQAFDIWQCGHAHERVLTSDEDAFTYQVRDINIDPGSFINHVYGEFRVRPADDRSEIVWR